MKLMVRWQHRDRSYTLWYWCWSQLDVVQLLLIEQNISKRGITCCEIEKMNVLDSYWEVYFLLTLIEKFCYKIALSAYLFVMNLIASVHLGVDEIPCFQTSCAPCVCSVSGNGSDRDMYLFFLGQEEMTKLLFMLFVLVEKLRFL